MKTLLLKLTAFLRLHTYVEAAEWTADDARALLSYLGTPHGAKFRSILRNTVIQEAVRASSQLADRDYHCGTARGLQLLVSTIETLSVAGPHSGNPPEDQSGATDHLEPYAP